MLRRGQTMDNAAQAARGLPPADAALASAIAGETLRRLPDLDALIDGATRQALPDDSKARMVLRLALAQKIGLGTPDHALVATACRWSTAARAGWSTACSARCCARACRHSTRRACRKRSRSAGAPPGAKRWCMAARRAIAQRPPLDLSFAERRRPARHFPDGHIARPAPSAARPCAEPVTELPGFDEGGWWVQDLAASLPARLIPAERQARARRLRRAGRQDDAAGRGGPSR